MLVTPWLRSIKQTVADRKTRKPASRRRQALRDSLAPVTRDVERLEDRTLLSAVEFRPDSHVVFIKDFDGVDDNITLDLRFDQTPTHGFGIFLSIEDPGGLETDDPAFHRVDENQLLIPLEWVHCFNIFGMKGDDMVEAEEGFFVKIKFDGGDGNDSFWGSLADDHFHGGLGDDEAFGQGGDDKLFGDEGDDLLVGGLGNDEIDGGKGADTVDGGDTTLAANVVRDGLNANETGTIDDGDDTVRGGDGNDLLIGGTGENNLNGGAGRDTIKATDYNPVFFNVTTGEDDRERVIDITIERGSNPGIPDRLWIPGTNVEDILEANPGGFFNSDRNDKEDGDGNPGMDPDDDVVAEPWDVVPTHTDFEEIEEAHIKRVLDDGDGEDTGGGAVAQAAYGQLSANTFNILDGGAADGIASFDEIGMVFVDAGEGNDTINGGPNADTIYGGNGDDVLNGNGGEDQINGDYAYFLSNGTAPQTKNVIAFHPEYDKPQPEGPVFLFEFATGHDTIFGGEGQDTLEGGLGSDKILGQGGRDYIYAFQHDGDRDGESHSSAKDIVNVDVDPGNDLLIDPPEAEFVPRDFPDRDSLIDEQDWPGAPLQPQFFLGAVGNEDSGHNFLDGGESADVIFGGELRDTIFGGPGGRSEYHDPALSETTTGKNQVQMYHLIDYDLIYTGLEAVYELEDPRTPLAMQPMTFADNLGAVEDIEGDLVGDHRFSRKFAMDFPLLPKLRDEDGGAGADLIFGTDEQDTLYGGGGHDTVVGGSESMLAGINGQLVDAPGDFISGGLGNDLLLGDLVDDLNSGHDTVFGNAGDDTINGGGGDDCLRGHAGDDSIAGGTGNDAISGNSGDDWLFGNKEGIITTKAVTTNDSDDITGGPGNDYLNGNDGDDILHGGTGNDTLTAVIGDGDEDDLDGGTGMDVLFHDETENGDQGAIVVTDAKATEEIAGKFDTFENIEQVFATAGPSGAKIEWFGSGWTAGSQTLIGGDADDVLVGGSGNDLIIGGKDTGGDNLSGNGGDDLIFSGYASFVVDDDSELPGGSMAHLEPHIYTDPEDDEQVKLSDLDLSMVDEFIVYDGEQARLLGDPYQGMHVGPKTGGRDWVAKVYKDGSDMFGKMNGNYIFSEDDLHILILNPDEQGDPKKGLGPKVETVVKVEGGLTTKPGVFDPTTHDVIGQQKLTGVIVAGINPETGKLSFDETGIDGPAGGTGDDIIIGSAGDDEIFGLEDDDLLVGADGNDTIMGNEGNDTIYGLDGGDDLMGNQDDDVVNGGEGNDNVEGNDEDDKLTGGPGDDTISGGKGDDTLFEIANIHAKVVYDGTANGFLEATVEGFGFGKDTIVGGGKNVVENLFLIGGDDDNDLDASGWAVPDGLVKLVGLSGDDTLEGTNVGPNDLDGGAGDDSIIGGDFDDMDGKMDKLVLGDGALETADDIIDGGPGNDTILAKDGDDVVFGWSGDDQINAGGGNDFVFGDLGNDTIVGDDDVDDAGSDTLAGGPGADMIWGGSNEDMDAPGMGGKDDMANKTIDGNEDGQDDFLYGDGRHVLFLGEDCPLEPNFGAPDLKDFLDGGSGDDGLSGGDDDDILIGGPDENILGIVDDTDPMSDPNSVLMGGGIDIDFNGDGMTFDMGGMATDWANDTLVGGAGDDTLFGGGGQDILIGQSGNDTLDGESGIDVVEKQPEDLVVPDGTDLVFGQDITENVGNFLKSILIDDPWGKDVFVLDGDTRLDWLDAI